MYKKIIKEWMASIVQRKQEWLIVHVVAPDARQTGSFFQMKSTVIDKLKADFNTDKRDRCLVP
jgi:trafficking protein particle complex subunit 10